MAEFYSGPLRVDANEAFQSAEEVLQFLDQVSDLNIEFLEQPMPAHNVEEYKKLKHLSSVPIMADESLQTQEVDDHLEEQFHAINVKLMKTGGYTKAIEQINQAKARGLKVMLGCMVETSLAIHGACAIGENVDWFDLDGFLFFEKEPFGLLKEENGMLKVSSNLRLPGIKDSFEFN